METLVKIADYFGVSVDYLLGRADESTNATEVQPLDIYYVDGDNNGIQSYKGTVNIGKPEESSDEMTTELIKVFKNLTTLQKAKAIIMINDLKNESNGT